MRRISFNPAPWVQAPVISGTRARTALSLPTNFGKLFFLCSLFSLFFSPPTVVEAAENLEQTEAELAVVTGAIIDIQNWLAQADARYSGAEKNLRDAEKEIAAVSQSAVATGRLLVETESELELLHNSINRLEDEKRQQSVLLAQSIRAAYMAGERSALKLLLNQQDLSRSARLLHYHRLFAESRIEKIESFQNTLDDISTANIELESRLLSFGDQQSELEQKLLALNAARSRREQALSELTASISSRSGELEQLEINRAELEALLKQIAEAMARVQSVANLAPFIDQRGKLPLPADGPVINQFGSRYGEGALVRQGITIGVAEGTPVQAVHAGRIVFSDWLRGSGLLVIVDHGEGYMSLYGANEALSKAAGDWVNAGEVLATSGSRGDRSAGVYFEIRYHGAAQNPSIWLQK
ncbi:MAG: peptidoglycan DD-metalloendopeptidase family protein [Proteobacteria bacterium]|nr:peptidoglycan DD-metalloendopeptidase family protein [Pseudomonadota bacterium]